jgi:hypothetical protein
MKATFAMAALYHVLYAAASVAVASVAAASACACATGHAAPSGAGDGGASGTNDAGVQGWVVAFREDFQHTSVPDAAWDADPVPDDGPFADHGAFFEARGVVPPVAYRTSVPLGADGWLRLESYTRSASRPFHDLADVTADPADPSNRVLWIASPAHTDATVIASASPLPERYRVSLRVGFANFGDGKPGLNGYAGGERAEPWWNDDATTQNGFYWLTILDAQPRPHNNSWIHHHRKVVVDSDNNYPAWTEMFDGSGFALNGEHPVMMFALDGRGTGSEMTGKPFLSYSAGVWQPSGAIRAVDAYLPGQWYRVSIERSGNVYTLEVSGRFRYGGERTYRASIDAQARCIWHFNRTPADDASPCLDETGWPSLGAAFPRWPAGQTWPDWFMFGDPHDNYYRGQVLYDDVQLEVWR